jgi:general nucleoside transport system permease protein
LTPCSFPVWSRHGRVHAGLMIGLALAVVLRIVMTRTLFGYEVKAVGANLGAARFAGIPARTACC